MVVLQTGTVLDAVSVLVLVLFVGLYTVSWVFGTDWWEGFWARVSRGFDGLRETHWLLPAVVVALGLAVYDVVAAALNAGGATLVLWFVVAGYASWLFATRHLFSRLHRRRLRSASTESDREDEDADTDTDAENGIPSSGHLR